MKSIKVYRQALYYIIKGKSHQAKELLERALMELDLHRRKAFEVTIYDEMQNPAELSKLLITFSSDDLQMVAETYLERQLNQAELKEASDLFPEMLCSAGWDTPAQEAIDEALRRQEDAKTV